MGRGQEAAASRGIVNKPAHEATKHKVTKQTNHRTGVMPEAAAAGVRATVGATALEFNIELSGK